MNDLTGLVQQCYRDNQAFFPDRADDLAFHALALAGELGELCNLIKKVERGSVTLDEARADIAEEAVDVLIYLCSIFGIINANPVRIYATKRSRNVQRFGDGQRKPSATTI